MKNIQKQNDNNEVERKAKTKEIEDATKYGEFICSYFAWTTLEEQKEKTKKLEKMTKQREKNDII